jgi:hypothetical protein
MNNKKGEYIMSKVKQWAYDEAEKKVDKILADFKSGVYNSTVAKNKIIMVDNVEMIGIDENNVDEVIDQEVA